MDCVASNNMDVFNNVNFLIHEYKMSHSYEFFNKSTAFYMPIIL